MARFFFGGGVWAELFFIWNLNAVKLVTLEHTFKQLLCHILKKHKRWALFAGGAGLDSHLCHSCPWALKSLPLGTQQTAVKQGLCGFALSLQYPGRAWTKKWEEDGPEAEVALQNGTLWGVRGQAEGWGQLRRMREKKGRLEDARAQGIYFQTLRRVFVILERGKCSSSSAPIGTPKPKKSGSSY